MPPVIVRHPRHVTALARLLRSVRSRHGYAAAVAAAGLVAVWWAIVGPWTVLPVTALAGVLAGSMWVAGWAAKGL
jgi:hypothetical protein